MWLWFVLAALVILIAWALWWVLGLGTSIPIIATVLVVVGLATLFIVRWILARRAATKLERAISAQASQQAMNARPERRAEIQELQKQLSQGIAALKTSKLGRGGQRGAAALYSMPWYMIIGPPGAGKTTALKHSGMVFPYGGGQGGGVRGVGGTRNCDWWFTNEAILLDTAGRYTTESDDRDEWISFLQFLLRYRNKRPINGIIIAISISEVLDANEQQVEAIGKKLRARIDEVMTQLKMTVPVYILFTKIDLVSGFVEFFGDLKKSDRSQAWGSTLKLDLPKNEPGKIFDAEFDVLVQRLHARALKRCAMERSREAREKLYQFPIEFAGMKKNLSDLIAVTFQPNAFQGTPILRGFYFTSGTQEGKPMDRVLSRMSAAMGIRTAEAGQQQQQANVESKSYFLHDVFMNIIFPDGDIAVRSSGELQRQALMRVAISGAALLLALTLAGPAASSYFKNKDFLKESEKRAKITSTLDWSDGKPVSTKFPPLKPTLEQLKELDKHQDEGVPIGMGWMMYSADKVRRPLLAVYVSQMQTGFVIPCKAKLEERLKSANGERYLRDRTTLKLYLMLNDVEHLDVEWATGRYTQLWTEVLKQSADISDSEIKDLARPHVAYYFELLKAGKITPLGLDTQLVKQVRDALQSISVQQRYYEMFVNSLNDERIDESGDPTIDNMVFPPIQLPRLFPDRQEVLKYFKSNRYETTKSYQEVEGPYTDKGHAAVVKQIEAAEGLIKAESWVVPPTPDETPTKIPEYVKGVAKAYEGKYISEWTDFFADIKVTTPTTADEAIDLYRIMSTTEYPLRRLLQSLEDNTQWKSANPLEANDAVAREVNRRFNQKLNMYTSGIILNVDLRSVGKQLQVIPEKFKSACAFAQTGKGDSKVFKYAEIVKRLREQIIEAKNQDPTLDLRKMNDQLQAARDAASQLTAGMDDTGVAIVKPLMLDGLNVGVRPTLGGGVDVNKLQPGQAPPKDGKTPPQTWNFPKNK